MLAVKKKITWKWKIWLRVSIFSLRVFYLKVTIVFQGEKSTAQFQMLKKMKLRLNEKQYLVFYWLHDHVVIRCGQTLIQSSYRID